MGRLRRQPTRGAATVETVLGVLVLVPVLLYGIHFSELGIVSMKVTEAGAAPLWEATAYPMHITGAPSSYEPMLQAAIFESNVSAHLRYRGNFDGRVSALTTDRSGRLQGALQYTQAFTAAGMLAVRCASSRAATGPSLEYAPFFISPTLPDNGGMACRSEAAAFNLIPNVFNEDAAGGGLSSASMKEGAANRVGIGLCSVGRPDGLFGPCAGAFSMMMDDWGLASAEFPTGGKESDICSLTLAGFPCENVPYYAVTNRFYQLATSPINLARAPHRQLVAATVGGTPMLMATDTQFYMSFTGEYQGFTMLTPSTDSDVMVWQTTPFIWPTTYGVGYGTRSKCYLGKGGC